MIISRKKHAAGFTLIELVIAVVIVGILAAIAIPSYRSFIVKGNRAVAQRALIELATKQEARFLRAHQYATTLTQLGLASDNAYKIDKRGAVTASATQALYEINMPTTGAAFVLTAVAVGKQAEHDPRCLRFVVNASGARTAFNATSGGTNTTAECWAD